MVSALQKSRNIDLTSIKKRCKVGVGKARPKNRLYIGFGKVLGLIWEGFGTVWGVSWTLWAASWSFLGHSKSRFCSSNCPSWTPRGLWDRFWKGLGRLLGRFREILGGVRETLGAPLGRFGRPGIELAFIAHAVYLLSHHILLQEPPRCLATPRGASQFVWHVPPKDPDFNSLS